MSSLFEVYRRDDNKYPEKISVYAVRNDKNGYPHFLIYEDNEWKYVKAKHFMPIIFDFKGGIECYF